MKIPVVIINILITFLKQTIFELSKKMFILFEKLTNFVRLSIVRATV